MPLSTVDILLIEDSADDAELTLRALRQENRGCRVRVVKDGEEALDFVFTRGVFAERRLEDGPKLILLDLKLPKVSGLEVLRQIKSHQPSKVIPVVVLTSSKEERDLKESYALGVNSYIVKPVDFDNFLQVVSKLGFYWLLMNEPPPASV